MCDEGPSIGVAELLTHPWASEETFQTEEIQLFHQKISLVKYQTRLLFLIFLIQVETILTSDCLRLQQEMFYHLIQKRNLSLTSPITKSL